MPKVSEFFENVQLPTMPDVARDLIATMRDDDIPFEKVRSAISRDPALTAKLIRLANSARFGLPRQVASLDDAITIDPEEIEDARWITREEMLTVTAGLHPEIKPARKGAIAHFLIANWLADRLD